MDAAYLEKRIRVITVTTRAAANSLGPADEQVTDAIRRGLALLAALDTDVATHGGPDTQRRLNEARGELETMLDAVPTDR